jgi:hypothetical protein
MTTQTAFRCYYDDGTILVSDFCPLANSNGSPLLKSELTIIEDVEEQIGFPWFLLVIAAVLLLSNERN